MEAEEWGRRIRAFRKLKGYTQAQLAESLGISLSILGEIERGNRLPNETVIEQVAQVLGITVDELIKFND
ncbi:putative HTH-type transcriptional regulator YazB [Pullulanibacillus camelliae]|uniref:Putative HTH-type transcriptional regulator YazB n=1 Tax=Pullulanibacillus camelliae TaxID=1707096 RepID=A0A8J3DZ01_9BACL|nr:helix-turn-helix transcriptional regulator [Pullulanibacillus camelliae]GGE54193.1 putative HTH-type transcriptional regulator YazB [Pullulanibacillus camelliae]